MGGAGHVNLRCAEQPPQSQKLPQVRRSRTDTVVVGGSTRTLWQAQRAPSVRHATACRAVLQVHSPNGAFGNQDIDLHPSMDM